MKSVRSGCAGVSLAGTRRLLHRPAARANSLFENGNEPFRLSSRLESFRRRSRSDRPRRAPSERPAPGEARGWRGEARLEVGVEGAGDFGDAPGLSEAAS